MTSLRQVPCRDHRQSEGRAQDRGDEQGRLSGKDPTDPLGRGNDDRAWDQSGDVPVDGLRDGAIRAATTEAGAKKRVRG
jgi:hypothetical protein